MAAGKGWGASISDVDDDGDTTLLSAANMQLSYYRQFNAKTIGWLLEYGGVDITSTATNLASTRAWRKKEHGYGRGSQHTSYGGGPSCTSTHR
jgi:hypothetical protein